MKQTRKDIFNTIKILRENEQILPAESKMFKDLVVKANEEDLEAIEEALYEAAEESSPVMEDIHKIAEIIYPQFSSKEEAVKFVKDNANFHTLEFAGFDVFEIYDSSNGVENKEIVYHAIIKVKYDGSEFGFGYNKSQKNISFTQDGDGPFFDSIKVKDDYDKALTLIKYVIEYVMGVM